MEYLQFLKMAEKIRANANNLLDDAEYEYLEEIG